MAKSMDPDHMRQLIWSTLFAKAYLSQYRVIMVLVHRKISFVARANTPTSLHIHSLIMAATAHLHHNHHNQRQFFFFFSQNLLILFLFFHQKHWYSLVVPTLKSLWSPGPSCWKLTMSLVNISLNLWSSNMAYMQIFLLTKCICKSYSHFSAKIPVN